jgi:hypothetical protein
MISRSSSVSESSAAARIETLDRKVPVGHFILDVPFPTMTQIAIGFPHPSRVLRGCLAKRALDLTA